MLDGPGEVTGERYFEVVTDPRLQRLVEQQMSLSPAADGLGTP